MTQSNHHLTPDLASRFAKLVLGHLTQEYPNKLTHSLDSAADVQSPRALYPIFYGSYDWHSCVHGYWLLTRLLTRYPNLPEAPTIRAVFNRQLTEANVKGELAYLAVPSRAGFERPYGWGWLLALQTALEQNVTTESQRWAKILSPLADAFVARFIDFLPKATYPVRVGTHFNTAFAMTLGLKYARAARNTKLETQICETAWRWHANDVNCQAWEPSGDEFLSPALMEAELMRQVLSDAEFQIWFSAFLPNLVQRQPATLFLPATVTDRSDGKIAHLDGLNFSRAWCQRSIARALPRDDPRSALLFASADLHYESAIAHVSGDYMGEHWLGTFALLALEA
ncbi:DUF2891 domain-containing protein [Glaciimonas immobilis]|uniref:DUF2891 domain-containing protein n=1 Tax=Glaciimonas immobilis TaxID=728004 RepID=A0A840RY88_9BURK|nr:DUF2891 domain-containing protein [Glaciimonas immobilis]KAF3998429.1 DUF2891 domain-containing protein [Glaciimonas immobilis]MBB5202078.1 hypothetical protein [Glaciimonas immobilis]